MWKIAVVLVLTALAILAARLAYDVPATQTHVGALTGSAVLVPVAPPLMYAGIRG